MFDRFVSGLRERASGDMPYTVHGLVNRPNEYDTPRSDKIALFISGHDDLPEAIGACVRRQAELDPNCWLCEVRSENTVVCEVVTVKPWVDHSLRENPWRYYGIMGEREEPESFVTFTQGFASRHGQQMLDWARTTPKVVHWPCRFALSDYAYPEEVLPSEPEPTRWDDGSGQDEDSPVGDVVYDVAVPAEVGPSEGAAMRMDFAQLQVQFLETARDLAQAVLEYKGDISAAPASVQSELRMKWTLFEVLLPSFRELVAESGGDLSIMPEPIPTVTTMLPWVVGMGSAWHGVDRETALRLLDDVQAIRPDLDVSLVRNAMYA